VQKALTPWAELQGSPRKILKKTPLVLAVCQVNFATKINATSQEVAGAFQEIIDPRYPISSQIEIAGFAFSATSGQSPEAHNLTPRTNWQFADSEHDWLVTLSNDSISLECRSYQHFGDFLERFSEILDATLSTVRPRIMSRVGLRYINEIRVESAAEVTRAIRAELLGALAVAPFSIATSRAIHTMQLHAEGDVQVNLNHGFLPAGTTIQPRDGEIPQEGPFYLIDLDVYHDFSQRSQVAMQSEVILDRVEVFHDTLSRIFWWSITEEFVNKSKGV
jgi:uncharacterized protein (TIGR04255 family)